MQLMKPARSRFAPSPTGYLHVGGIRTALFAWLVARQSGGQFILRIEDTDRARHVAEAEQHIIKSLRALGLAFDEGPDIGGPFGPYRQSDRLDIYKTWAERLIQAGRAYADPYSPEQVEAFRKAAQAAKKPFLFREHRPAEPKPWDGTTPLRFLSEPKAHRWHDEVMGDLHTGPEVVDDFILIKSDGYPTYNFAHIVDDAEMHITHVIRGIEFVSSTPNFMNLYEALNLPVPIIASMPPILGPSGTKKLSKRDGAKDVLDYLRDGYLPDAFLSFIASLGWNDGTEQEIFTREDLIQKFSLARVHRAGARFDEKRLAWTNGIFIRQLPLDELFVTVQDFWPDEAKDAGDDYKRRVLALVQDRLKFAKELPELTRFFFTDLPVNPTLWQEHTQLKKLSSDELKTLLLQSRESLAASDFGLDDLTTRLNALLEQTQQKPAVLFSLIRIATTQAPFSPGLADTLAVLGKQVSLRRIDAMLATM